MSFSNMKLHPSLLSGVKELGFTTPTPIQADAIPPAVEGRDVLACAMTGSGKTEAALTLAHRLLGHADAERGQVKPVPGGAEIERGDDAEVRDALRPARHSAPAHLTA